MFKNWLQKVTLSGKFELQPKLRVGPSEFFKLLLLHLDTYWEDSKFKGDLPNFKEVIDIAKESKGEMMKAIDAEFIRLMEMAELINKFKYFLINNKKSFGGFKNSQIDLIKNIPFSALD